MNTVSAEVQILQEGLPDDKDFQLACENYKAAYGDLVAPEGDAELQLGNLQWYYNQEINNLTNAK